MAQRIRLHSRGNRTDRISHGIHAAMVDYFPFCPRRWTAPDLARDDISGGAITLSRNAIPTSRVPFWRARAWGVRLASSVVRLKSWE
jgi:hypothetical protein